jgi:lysophospholipase L1-like esterase
VIFNFLSHTLLLPILLVQATFVRARAMMLPDPSGPRHGVVGQGPLLRVLIIGDSSALGVGVETQAQALSGLLTARLSRIARVEFDLVAVTGARTVDAVGWLDHLPRSGYDVVVTALGVNDVTKATPLRRFVHLQARLMDRLVQDYRVKRLYVSGLPPMGQFPLLPQPLRWAMGRRAAWFEKHLRRLIDSRPAARFVTIDMGLDGTNMSADGFHPGPTVYAAWADIVYTQITGDPALLDAAGQST